MPKMLDDSYNPNTGKRQTWDQFAAKYKWKQGWNKVRLFGLVYSDARHDNIKTKTGKAYNEFCHGYDVDNDRFFPNRRELCDCCALDMPHKIRNFVNILAVDEWEKRPASPSSDWNPFYVIDMSQSLHSAVMALKELNNGCNVGDVLNGALIGINYNKDAPSPALTYSVSLLQPRWQFTQEMLDFTFSQNTPDGRREVRRGNGKLPPAWVYYPCRSTRDDMQRSLRTHGHLGGAPAAGSEVNAGAKAKGDKLMSELSSLVKEGEPAIPAGGVAQLAKLREEPDHTPPPPPAAPKAAPQASSDEPDVEIPF